MSETVIARDLYIGRTSGGDRLYLDVVVRERAGRRETVEHEWVEGAEELSIVGTLRHRGRDIGGGQCIDSMWDVLDHGQVARGADRADVRLIADIWGRWHLNTLKAGCAHVEPVGKDTGSMLDSTPPCPVTGYRWGSAWLYEPLPDGVVSGLAEACRRVVERL